MGEWGVVGAALLGVAGVLAVWERKAGAGFEQRREAERARLVAQLAEAGAGAGEGTGEDPGAGAGSPGRAAAGDPKYADVGGIPRGYGRDRPEARGDAGFTAVLVEYYAYGLAQARSSFATSQRFAGVGAAILLVGVALGVWKAESTGELYLGIVISSVGVVVTLVGQLFHRRADIALRHMADQTAALREDRRAAAAMQQAVGLLDEVADPELRARLQAGLIMKLSGAELPR
ncbi:hypothetical protein ACFV2Q_37470 [Streptomyces sp. NPDC059650]|uniref:TRADD-N-associated membrane domain-containing protein n=1 Tax=Streptomyces sp. NPDC059650 TaxID=3346896 RepID=UPI0036CB146C